MNVSAREALRVATVSPFKSGITGSGRIASHSSSGTASIDPGFTNSHAASVIAICLQSECSDPVRG